MHPGPVGQVGEPHPVRCRVAGGDGDDELLVPQLPYRPVPGAGLGPDGEVRAAGGHGGGEGVGVRELQQPDAGARVALVPGAQHREQQPEGDRVDGGDLDLPAVQTGGAAGGGAGPFGVGECGAGVREHRAAHRGRPDGPREAFQQRAAGVPFQGADLVGQGGLGDVQQLGRAGEGAGVDDGDEVFELTQRCHEQMLWQR